MRKSGIGGMSKRVCLSTIRICGNVKTCFLVEHPDCWVCQNVFLCRKSGFLGMSKRVFLLKIRIVGYVKTCLFVENPNASTLRRARASVRDPRVVFAKGARTACGSAGNAIKFAREAKMLQNVTMSFDLATALEVRSVHRLSRLTPNMLRLTTPYVALTK